MRRILLAAILLFACREQARAGQPTGRDLQACILAAAQIHSVPASAMVILLMIEGGRLGMRSPNTNGTGDLGPFQVNEIWVPKIARYWGVPEGQAYTLLRDDLCSNADAAGWIFGANLRDVGDKVWEGVARYHSMRPDLQNAYLNKAFDAAQRLLRKPKRG